MVANQPAPGDKPEDDFPEVMDEREMMSLQGECSPKDDHFGPPEKPCEVTCLHCGKRYGSELIVWRVSTMKDGSQHGFWCCPVPGCDGAGFLMDIYPVDPNWDGQGGVTGGWFDDDGNPCPPPWIDEENGGTGKFEGEVPF
ncbi:MAG TPA: hypothetical protein VD997_08150 [Phycisphaerales bacterium]|nr:hypothetical protein [Phycisphaerales bacterium]